MRFRTTMLVAATLLAAGYLGVAGFAQEPGFAGKVGEKLDEVGRGIMDETRKVTDAVGRRFDTVRSDVNRMGTHHRVYARLHWDKALNSSRIEVHLIRGGGVLLRGTVPDVAAKRHAVALAASTVDVTQVVDELTPLAPPVPSTTLTPPGDR
jgi:hyperosmotically inducible periplasmic protein